jgi:hypothetical protein
VACAAGSPTSPGGLTPWGTSASSASYDGQWTGTTSQGTEITFAVSAKKVTAVTVAYNFNGCSGVKTLSNVDISLADDPTGSSVAVYSSGPTGGPDQTLFDFRFTRSGATGSVTFFGYSGCGNGRATWTGFTESIPPFNFEGQWSGTTSQGTAIAFTVSSAQTVTALTLGYAFGGCSGTKTFSDLSAAVYPSGPGPTFAYATIAPDGASFTEEVIGTFASNAVASGVVLLSGYPGCGNPNVVVSAIWTAARH